MQGHELAKALRAAYLSLHRLTDARFARWGVTANQFVVLAVLSEEDALTQRELVARTHSDPSTLRAMLVLLERKGFIRRREHPTDKRARSVTLTSKGRRTFEGMWADSEDLRQRLVAAVRSTQTNSLIVALQRIAAAMAPESADARQGRDRAK
jgi:DNA-binding MarR family transcriptional regulator